MDPATYFWLLLKATLLSSGGLGNLPSVHQDFLGRGWASEPQFAGALAVGQIAPGPNGLWVVALGVITAGWWGALLATVAVLLPPLLVIPIGRLHNRYSEVTAVKGFVLGLSLAVAASVPVVYLKLVAAFGFDLLSGAILAVALVLLASRRAPLIAVLGAGAAAGVLLYRGA